MITKICTKCSIGKDIESFGIQKRGLYGKRSICKKCVSDFNKEYSSKRMSIDPVFREKKIQNARNWTIRNPEKRSMIAVSRNRKEREMFPDRVKARALVNQRVRFGRILRASSFNCVECGRQAAHYHHYLGYAFENRYNVVPVCEKCHASLG